VLPRCKVAEPTVVAARDVGELSQLARGEESIGDRDAQHRSVALDVQPVAQPQRAELVLRELPGEMAPHLVAEFRDSPIDERLIQRVVLVHADRLYARPFGPLNTVWLGAPLSGVMSLCNTCPGGP